MSKRQRSVQSPPLAKLILLGSEGAGKSALLVRFFTRRFIGEYDPTLESTHRRKVEIGSSILIIDIKDTAGENDTHRRENDYLWGDVFILVYSVTDRNSFQEIQKLRKAIELIRGSSAIFVFIANKKDLHHLREVSMDEGKRLADKHSSLFFEISVAEDYHETNKVFNEIIRHVVTRKAMEEGGANGKKRNNSYSSILKGLKAKDHKEKKHEHVIHVQPGGYSS